MKSTSSPIVFACLAVLLALSGSTHADDFTLDWWTFDGGGDFWTTGGDFELSGTIGQPDAGGPMTGGDFELTGGFWVEAIVVSPCPGDLDGDGDTDQSDLGILLASWGVNGGGDLDGDGDTDQADLGVLLSDWGCGT